jgi:uncharacterized membrane protein
MKKLLSIMALFVISLLAVSMVSAVDEGSSLGGLVDSNGDLYTDSLITVEVNDEDDNSLLAVEEGDELEVEVRLVNGHATDGASNVEVEAKLMGYDEEDTRDLVVVEKVHAGTVKEVNLNVQVPTDFANGAGAILRITISGGNNELVYDYELFVESQTHSVDIVDVSFSPGNTVRAGRSLLTTVLVENTGESKEEDVKVTVEIPALGLSTSEFVDEVEVDGKEDVPEMFLPIPVTAASGDYEVKVTVEYEDLERSVSETYTVHVEANEVFNENKLVLAVGPESQKVTAGNTAKYALGLTNAGSVSKAFTFEVATGSWASSSLSEMMVVLEPGENQVVYVDLAVANDAAPGEHVASLTVKSSNNVLQTVALKADVTGNSVSEQNSNVGLRNGLEIALIVLVVLLVIVGLIIGFSRLRRDEEDEEQAYY